MFLIPNHRLGFKLLQLGKYLLEDDPILRVCFVACLKPKCYFLHFLVAYDGKLYIFAGYNDVVGLHFNDLHEFNPLTSIWRRIKTSGIPNPIPRRRQCCLVVGHRMYMFGGTSPVTASLFLNNPEDVQDIPGNRLILYDQSDLYVLDFGTEFIFPSLF